MKWSSKLLCQKVLCPLNLRINLWIPRANNKCCYHSISVALIPEKLDCIGNLFNGTIYIAPLKLDNNIANPLQRNNPICCSTIPN